MTSLDWAVVVLYFIAMLIIGLAVTKRARGSLAEYFVSGRRLNWFLAGASLVATSFASDTPLWVSGLVRRYGVHTVWQYWATALGAGVAVFVFARLWRRLAVLTDLEFIELRYEGRGAAVLRGLYALYSSLIFNSLVIGWVTKAMQLIVMETLQLSEASSGWAVALALAIALIYCAFSGLWGVVLTDLIQIILATFGTIALAYFAVRAVGGLDVLVQRLHALPTWPGKELTMGPKIGTGPGYLSVWNTVAFACLLWWPLAVSNGYMAQRVLATTDERASAFTMLMYSVVYWGINAWPWIIMRSMAGF
jgi:solute:Na+ symporter, SSS family